MEKQRQKDIHDKGFNISSNTYRRLGGGSEEYANIRVGTKLLKDAVLNLGTLSKVNTKLGSKYYILKALWERDLPTLREISNFFYRTNGIYFKTCNTYATLYRYDWYIAPEVLDENTKEEKVLEEFTKTLNFLDNSNIQKLCEEMALEVIINGAYYGYLVNSEDKIVLQQLPINYCRSRYSVNGYPAVEFDMRFFDLEFRDDNYRTKILNLFPKEFKKGYSLYRQGKLPSDCLGEKYGSWYLLEPGRTVKFNFYNSDVPLFTNAIPAIIDLDAAQDLDRRKQMQQLLKILIQKLPLDKNGDLIFDIDEARDIHENAKEMLERTIGVDVLTTFADIQVEDLADKNSTTTTDDLEKMERTVYNALGISKNLFNTDGNLSLEKSILNDEGIVRSLLLSFGDFFNKITRALAKTPKKFTFKFYMLETTQYNYKDISKMYKEQVQIGYSKMLPQVALGHSQSSIINTAHFENEVLHLSDLMLPPLQSSTMNADSLKSLSDSNEGNGKTGRPKKDDGEKADKTILNEESQT